MTSRNPLDVMRVAVAGLGFGAQVHVPGFRAIADVCVVGLASRSLETAAAAAAAAGVAAACSGIDELLDLDLDAVSIALPPAEAAPAVAAALAAGVPVLTEKPLAASLPVARRLAQSSHGIVTGVDFQFAELHTFQALRNVIASGDLGPVREIAVSWLTESYAQRHGLWSWKTDAEAGGGVMSLLGCHALYLLEWLAGPVVDVVATLDRRATRRFAPPGSFPAADTAEVVLGTRNRFNATMRISNAAPGVAEHRWDVVFEGGKARARNTGPDYMAGFALDVAPEGEQWRTVAAEPVAAGDGRLAPFGRLAERFVGAVRGGPAMRPDFRDGLRVQDLLAAVERSSADGTRVALSESAHE